MYTDLEIKLAKELFDILFVSEEEAFGIVFKYIRSKDYSEIVSNNINTNITVIVENLDAYM